MYNIKSAPHKADSVYTVHMHEIEADYDRDDGYEVTVTKEGFPPHAREVFAARDEAEARFKALTDPVAERPKENTMKLKDAMLQIEYSANWRIYAKSTELDAQAQYAQASERTYILEDQGYRYITDGEEIGDYIAEYCDGVPAEDREDFATEAIELFVESLAQV